MAEIKSIIDPSKNLTIHTIIGKLTAKELTDHLLNFYSSEKPTKNALWDLTKTDSRKIAKIRKKFNDLRKGGKTAFVYSRNVGYGMGRVYETHADLEGLSTTYNLFYNIDDALEWIQS